MNILQLIIFIFRVYQLSRRTFENAGLTYKIDKVNLFNYIWNINGINYPAGAHIIGNYVTKKDMKENDWVSSMIDYYGSGLLSSVLTKENVMSAKHGIRFQSLIGNRLHKYTFKKNFTFVETDVGLDAFKNSQLYKENSSNWKIMSSSALNIEFIYGIDPVSAKQLRLSSGEDRILYLITWIGKDNKKVVTPNHSYSNGLFCHFINYDVNKTLDPNIYGKITDWSKINLLFNPSYQLEISNIKDESKVIKSTDEAL